MRKVIFHFKVFQKNRYSYLFRCKIPAADIFEFHSWCTFLPRAVQNDIWRKSRKKLYSLTHFCSNYISACQFFPQRKKVILIFFKSGLEVDGNIILSII